MLTTKLQKERATMSYDIYIGKAEQGVVKREELPMAPKFPNDEMTGQGNSRHPSYTGWGEFCREAGLYDLFFNKETGLMREHPGTVPLKECHLHVISEATANWMQRQKERGQVLPPGFEAWDPFDENEGTEQHYDYILARLLWLRFWVYYALGKYKEQAAIHNH